MMQRIGSIDTLKWFAILLVVVGHFVDLGVAYSDNYKALATFIYAFHMPLFIFLSGLFDRPREKFPLDSVIFFVALGIILQIIYYYLGIILDRRPGFTLFSYVGLPWFMFAVAGWRTLAYFLANRSTCLILTLSVILGMTVRYDISLNFDLFHIGQIIIFFPFYFAGFTVSAKSVIAKLNNPSVAAVSALFIIGFLIACFTFPDTLYGFRSIFTAHTSYEASPLLMPGFVSQLIAYTLAAILCVSFISIFSYIKCGTFEKFGQRTLAVYAWHFPVIHLLEYIGVPEILLNGATGYGGFLWI